MEGPDKACSALGKQMMLPLRHGLHTQSGEVADAAFVAGACQVERNLKGLSAALCPLQGAGTAPARRRSVNARYAEQCKWDAAAKDLPQYLDGKNGLLGSQQFVISS